jgi:hypothetical protein
LKPELAIEPKQNTQWAVKGTEHRPGHIKLELESSTGEVVIREIPKDGDEANALRYHKGFSVKAEDRGCDHSEPTLTLVRN